MLCLIFQPEKDQNKPSALRKVMDNCRRLQHLNIGGEHHHVLFDNGFDSKSAFQLQGKSSFTISYNSKLVVKSFQLETDLTLLSLSLLLSTAFSTPLILVTLLSLCFLTASALLSTPRCFDHAILFFRLAISFGLGDFISLFALKPSTLFFSNSSYHRRATSICPIQPLHFPYCSACLLILNSSASISWRLKNVHYPFPIWLHRSNSPSRPSVVTATCYS